MSNRRCHSERRLRRKESLFALLRNGTRIFTDAADFRGYKPALLAFIRRIRVYARPIFVENALVPSRTALVPNRTALIPSRAALIPSRTALIPARMTITHHASAFIDFFFPKNC